MPLVSDQLRCMVEDFGDEVAYRVDGVGEMTYAQWDAAASRHARALLDAGTEPQDRVALALTGGDGLAYLQAYMGTHKAGAINVPVNVRLSRGELGHVLDHSEPRVLVVSAALLDRFAGVVPEVASLERVVVVGGDWEDAPVGVAVRRWEDHLAGDDRDVQVDITEEDVADILYTSGTTGRPKGVMARHNRATQIPVGKPDELAGQQWLHASPLFTFAGVSFICVPIALGFTGVYMPRFDAARWLDIVEQEPVGMAFLVPAMVELIVQEDDFEDRDLSSLTMVSVGSAPIAPATLRYFHEQLPNATVSNAYSMTEAGSAYCVMPPGAFEEKPGSVGQPLPPLEVRIVDDDGRDLPAGEVGEIVLRNPGKEREYFRNEEATEETWEDGWLHTGDLGRLDEDGFLFIVGRKKDVIIRGGHNVYAGDVEDVVYEHPAVREAAVVGIPHEVLGEDVAAFVVPVEGAELSPQDVIDWCEDRVADYKRPRHVRIVSELPRNAMGKVLKRELRDTFPSSERISTP